MKINRKQRQTHLLLFPGWKLDEKVESGKSCAPYTGEIFEAITEVFLGGRRITIDSTEEVCPDILFDDDATLAVESKASNCRSGHKISHGQLERYEEMERLGWRVLYCFWLYGIENLSRSFDTVGQLVQGVVESIESMTLLSTRFVRLIRDTKPAGAKEYDWRAKYEYGARRGGWMDVWRPTLMNRLHDDPLGFITCELDRMPGEFEITEYKAGPISFDFNGIIFTTPEFKVLEVREGVAPF